MYIMTIHSDVQARARAEVDAVIGHDRLVTTMDWEQLQKGDIEMPYITALIKEILRWGTVAPLGKIVSTCLKITDGNSFNRFNSPRNTGR